MNLSPRMCVCNRVRFGPYRFVTALPAALALVCCGARAQNAHTSLQPSAVPVTSVENSRSLPDDPGVLFSSSQQQQVSDKTQAPADGAQTKPTNANPEATPADPDKPDAPAEAEPQQTSRILGIVPNFQSVTADQKLPPETVKQKFTIAARNSFDYSSFLLAGVQAGFAQNSKSYPEFRQGGIGYFRYYWHTLADTADENFMVGGLFPSVFHEDSRFYTLGHGSFLHRAGYASSRIFVIRNDHGNDTVNLSEIVGAGAAAEVSSLYYPVRYHTWTKVGQKWLTSALIDSANYTFKEFWPSINRKFFHEH